MSVTFATPTLETERLILRAPRAEDAQAFAAHYASERSQYVGGPIDSDDAWEFFAIEIGHWVLRGYGMFIATRKDDDTAIGIVGHWHPHHWPEKEVGWVLFNEKDEGKGLAFEAAKACIAHAWTTLKWDTIVSYIDPRNTASITLAERLGATRDKTAKFPNPLKPWGLVYRHPAPEGL